MNKNNFKEIILPELKIIVIAGLIFYLFFQIHYYKENIFLILKTVIAHFYLFIIPGYSLCLIFYGKINRIERLIIGIGIGYGLQPFLLFLINAITGVNIMKYYIYVSAALILIGLLLFKFIVLRKISDIPDDLLENPPLHVPK